MSPQAALVRVGAACAAAALLLVAAALARYAGFGFDDAGTRMRLVIAFAELDAAAVAVGLAGTVLLAVGGAPVPLRRAAAGSAVLVAAGSVAVGIAGFTFPGLPGEGYAYYALVTAAAVGVAAAALWLAQPVADPAGEAPDGGLGGGDLVGEPDAHGLLGLDEAPPS